MNRSRLLPIALTVTVLPLLSGLVEAPASAASTRLTAKMTAEEEVPAPGPAGGKGTAAIEIRDGNTLCYDLTLDGVDEPNAGHVHKGAKGLAGAVVVDLKLAENGLKACVPADPAAAEGILADPAGHYVNVHTAQYKAGAVRGQLAPG